MRSRSASTAYLLPAVATTGRVRERVDVGGVELSLSDGAALVKYPAAQRANCRVAADHCRPHRTAAPPPGTSGPSAGPTVGVLRLSAYAQPADVNGKFARAAKSRDCCQPVLVDQGLIRASSVTIT
jgi:hypothetical protein